MDDPQAVVSPGGVGFDINCGVRGTLFLSSYFASCRCGCWEPTWGRKTCSLWRSNWLSLSLTTFQWVGGWAWVSVDRYCNLVVVLPISGLWILSVCVWWCIFFSSCLIRDPQVGVGSKGIIPMGAKDLEEALEMGMDWSLRQATYFHLLLFLSFQGGLLLGWR